MYIEINKNVPFNKFKEYKLPLPTDDVGIGMLVLVQVVLYQCAVLC